jgi:hypothetical protein
MALAAGMAEIAEGVGQRIRSGGVGGGMHMALSHGAAPDSGDDGVF